MDRICLREKLEYLTALFFINLSKILPQKFMFCIFNALSVLLFYILKSRRRLAIENIQKAYPDLSYKDACKIAKDNFKSLGKTLCETLLIYNDRKNLEDMIINGSEIIDEINKLSENGKRAILFITAHFGNWELLANYVAYKGIKLLVVGRDGNNKLIQDKITTPSRVKFGNTLANKDNAMIKMVKFLKSGKNAGILMDQKSSISHSLITTFFKRECRTSTSIAILKLKFNPVIIPIFSIRQANGKYKIVIKKFDDTIVSGDSQRDLFNITQKINDIFEEVVRDEPSQWFWMHNRWKMD